MKRRKFMSALFGGSVLAALCTTTHAKRNLVATITAIKVPGGPVTHGDVDHWDIDRRISHALTRDMSLQYRKEGMFNYRDVNKAMGECFALFHTQLVNPRILEVNLWANRGIVSYQCDFHRPVADLDAIHPHTSFAQVSHVGFSFLGAVGDPVMVLNAGDSNGEYTIQVGGK